MIQTTSIEFPAPGRSFPGAFFHDAGASPVRRPGVLVLHGGAGPGAHEAERAQRLVALGYCALVPDLFGETFAERARGLAVIGALVQEPESLRQRVRAALSWLQAQPQVDARRTAAIGFCFGGLAALELARSGADARVVASFHGGLSTARKAAPGAVRTTILVCTGAADPFAPRDLRAALEDELAQAGCDWQMHVYGGAQHGFTERAIDSAKRPGCAYDAAADARSWAAMTSLFAEVLCR